MNATHAAWDAGNVARKHPPGAYLLPSFLLFGLAVGAALLWRLGGGEAWWLPLLAGSGLAAWTAWHRYPWRDGWSRYLSFGAVMLLACAANRVLYLGDLLLGDGGWRDWPFLAPHPEANMISAEVATVLGTLLTVAAWIIAGGARFSPRDVLDAPRAPLVRLLGVTYFASLMALVLSAFVPQVLLVSGQLLPTMLALGATTAFFLPFLLTRALGSRLSLVVLMSLPFVYVALGTGMKENILLALAPSAHLLWTHARRRGARAALVATGLLVAAFATSYIGFFRAEVWYADRAIDQSAVFADFSRSVSEEGLPATLSGGMEDFLQRSDAFPYRGWTIAVAESDGSQPGLVFEPLFYVFMPRVLWPDKPLVRQGWEFSGLVFGPEYITWSDSSLSAGLYPALYLGAGWGAVLVGALALGFLLACMVALANRMGGPVLAGLYTLSLLPYALRLDEAWTVGAFSGPVINLAYIALLYLLARTMSGLLRFEARYR
jgi:hypothetical protein